MSLPLHGLQVLFFIGCAWVLVRWDRVAFSTKGLLLMPIAYLGGQFFFVLNADYPRHILIGHLAMGLVAILLSSQRACKGPENLNRLEA